MIEAIAFYLFATVVIASAVLVIFSRNPVHSVLWLILAFFNAAGLFLLLGAEFIAMLLVIVYVGAVAAWNAGDIGADARAAPVDAGIPNIQLLGTILYTRYLYIFEAAGLVLLVAMIGAIVLTHRKRGGTRPQNISAQNRRRPQDATRNIDQPVGQGVEL